MSQAVRLITLEKTYAVATLGDALLVIFRPGPTEGRATASWETGLHDIARAGGKPFFFGVIEPESDPPDDAARQAFSRFFERHRDTLAGFFVVVEGVGFRSAMVRTIVTAILTVLPRFRLPFARHVTSSVEEAAALAAGASPGLDTAALLAAVRDLRAREA